MSTQRQASSFPLRLEAKVKVEAKNEAVMNRRSLNAEIGLLIEEGLKWRKAMREKATA